jgi:hypothetical protein
MSSITATECDEMKDVVKEAKNFIDQNYGMKNELLSHFISQSKLDSKQHSLESS